MAVEELFGYILSENFSENCSVKLRLMKPQYWLVGRKERRKSSPKIFVICCNSSVLMRMLSVFQNQQNFLEHACRINHRQYRGSSPWINICSNFEIHVTRLPPFVTFKNPVAFSSLFIPFLCYCPVHCVQSYEGFRSLSQTAGPVCRVQSFSSRSSRCLTWCSSNTNDS